MPIQPRSLVRCHSKADGFRPNLLARAA